MSLLFATGFDLMTPLSAASFGLLLCAAWGRVKASNGASLCALPGCLAAGLLAAFAAGFGLLAGLAGCLAAGLAWVAVSVGCVMVRSSVMIDRTANLAL